MVVVSEIIKIREIINEYKRDCLSVGFVPTMGFLHEGHKSLIDRAKKENQKVVASIFVNPLQFGPNEDFDKYPRNLEEDLKICENSGVDVVFAPSVKEMYPLKNLVFVDAEKLGEGLCGANRPGHFRGVCTVVSKLFNIVAPNRAYFGEKDAQQLAIIKKMVSDLNFDIEIVPCPIIRESDGLAMSSRNVYLSRDERSAALSLSKGLGLALRELQKGERNAKKIKDIIIMEIQKEPLADISYVEVVDSITLQAVDEVSKPILVAIAVKIGKTRLIDNFTFLEV